MLPMWDFALTRPDGTGLRLHPQWSKRKVFVYPLDGHPNPVEPPRKGLGKTDGKGSFQRYLTLDLVKVLSFDAKKEPVLVPPQSAQDNGGAAVAAPQGTA